ncbi:MAG: endo-1,4-beta-xylanase [Bdellovibrionales bacterium]
MIHLASSSVASKKITRRDTLCAFARAAATFPVLGLLNACGGFSMSHDRAFRQSGLRALAARRGWHFGAAAQSGQLDDPAFARSLAREVNALVPENELKWDALRPSPETFDFRGFEELATFADEHGMILRGHTLVWHESNPAWLESLLKSAPRADAEKILREHITRVTQATQTHIREWDVVNEAIDPRSSRKDGLRETLWLQALGDSYIALAFRAASEADSGLRLVYNDFGLERGDGYGEAKRKAALRLLENLRARGAPIHGLGLQSHLRVDRPLGGRAFTDFLARARCLGLEVSVTELDMRYGNLMGDAEDKDALAQDYLRAYLEQVQQSAPLKSLLTWGLSDRYSWLRQDDDAARGMLPLDVNLERVPMWETLREAWLV